MAESIILRPVRDVTREHSIPEGYEGVYQLINEEVADNDSTCIDFGNRIAENESKESMVGFEQRVLEKKKIVEIIPHVCISNCSETGSDAWLVVNVGVGDNVSGANWGERVDAERGGGYQTTAIFPGTTSVNKYLYSALLSNTNAFLKKNDKLPELKMILRTVAHGMNNKNNYGRIRVTQAYLEIVYEDITDIGVFKKANGVVKAATAAYRKLGGSWAEVTEEEAKDVLKNNIITEGMT